VAYPLSRDTEGDTALKVTGYGYAPDTGPITYVTYPLSRDTTEGDTAVKITGYGWLHRIRRDTLFRFPFSPLNTAPPGFKYNGSD